MQDVASPPPVARTPGGAALPTLLLVVLLAGPLAWALRRAQAPDSTPAGRGRDTTPTVVRDVLTGRLTAPDGTPAPPTSGWGRADRPLRLRFVPSGDKEQAGTTIEDMIAFLRRRTGYAIDGAILRSYGLVVQEIVQGQCEVAFLTAASYARARYATWNNDDPDDDIVAFLAAVRDGHPDYPGSDLAYRGALIAHVDSPLTRVEDLTPAHVVAMGNRTSGASSILPTALLGQLGLDPKIHRLEGYPVIVTAVLQKSADVGCVWWSVPSADRPQNDGRRTVLESQPDVFAQTKILGYTSWIPNEPVVIRKAVDPAVRHVLARAIALYVANLASTPEGRRRLESIGSVIGYLPADDADFEPLMEVIERAFAKDPEGRRDFMAGSK